jgi:predicted TIM-barrel fold metal-dependent hydrolase
LPVVSEPEKRFPPAGACDCHVHVIGPKRRFPLAPGHRYTPKDALAAELAAMLGRLGMDRVVLVQPSFYATDNACMLDAMAQIANSRGVAVLAAQTPAPELDALHARGVRGLRINIATLGPAPIETIKRDIAAAARLCERHGWHVQVFVAADAIEPLAPLLKSLPVAAVFDHFGLIAPGTVDGPLRTLCGLLETGKIWVKISGAYRIADDPKDARTDALAKTLCAANPERIVWGSDWPHTPRHDLHNGGGDQELPFQAIDTRGLLDLIPRWLDDEALVRRVLVDNPTQLYDFD